VLIERSLKNGVLALVLHTAVAGCCRVDRRTRGLLQASTFCTRGEEMILHVFNGVVCLPYSSRYSMQCGPN
jgi:hypothetical protein